MSRPEINVIIELDIEGVSISVSVTPSLAVTPSPLPAVTPSPLPADSPADSPLGPGEVAVEGHEQLQGLEVVARVVFGILVVVDTG